MEKLKIGYVHLFLMREIHTEINQITNIGVNHMRYVMTFFWGIILIQMLNYILGSMTSVENLTFGTALGVGVIFSVCVIILGNMFNEQPPSSAKDTH